MGNDRGSTPRTVMGRSSSELHLPVDLGDQVGRRIALVPQIHHPPESAHGCARLHGSFSQGLRSQGYGTHFVRRAYEQRWCRRSVGTGAVSDRFFRVPIIYKHTRSNVCSRTAQRPHRRTLASDSGQPTAQPNHLWRIAKCLVI